MKHCQYCAQTETKLDGFGYCIEYDCFERSGKKKKLEVFVKQASDIWLMPNRYVPLGITSYVTNYYYERTRKANNIMHEAKREFGYVPFEIIKAIPEANRGRWDKNIKW